LLACGEAFRELPHQQNEKQPCKDSTRVSKAHIFLSFFYLHEKKPNFIRFFLILPTFVCSNPNLSLFLFSQSMNLYNQQNKKQMKQPKVSFLLTCLLTFFISSWGGVLAQKAKITGTVFDGGSTNNDPILGAIIGLFDKSGAAVKSTETDFVAGEYRIEVEPGTYKVVISYSGYEDFTKEITLAADEELKLNCTLSEKVNQITEITVTLSRKEQKLEESVGQVAVVPMELIANGNITRADDAVAKVPGVTVADGQANIRGGSGYSYGAGSRVLLLVDDMPILQADAGFPNWRDLPIENLSQIEVLKGAGSALYGSSALNGIIHLRTAYAKSEPETEIAVYGTGFGTPARANTAWWKYDSVATNDGKFYADDDTAVGAKYHPALLKNRAGYNKPMEAGFQFAHRRQFNNKLFWTLGANAYYFDSYRAGEYDRKFRINSNLEYRVDSVTKIGLNANFNVGRGGSFFIWGNSAALGRDVDSAIYIPYDNTITENQIMRFNIDPYMTKYDKKGGKHRLQGRYYHVQNNNNNNQSNTSNLFYGEYQYAQTIKSLANMSIVTGAVGQGSFINAQLYGNAKYTIANAAAYAQLAKGFLPSTKFTKEGSPAKDRLNIEFGARVEFNSINSPDSVLVSPTTGKILNPEPKSRQARPVFRAGFNYQVAEFTRLRASWGQGYRYPTIAERYISTVVGPTGTGLEIRANPKLQAETGWSADIGLVQGLAIPGTKWKALLEVSAFWTEYQNMMEFTFKGGDTLNIASLPIIFSSINIGNAVIPGAEISLMGQGEIGGVKTNILTGYTYINPYFKDFSRLQQKLSSDSTNDVLKYRNRHVIKLDIESFFLKDDALSIGVSFNYASAMETIDRAFENLNAFGNANFPLDLFGVGVYRNGVPAYTDPATGRLVPARPGINQSQIYDLSARIGYKYFIREALTEEQKKTADPAKPLEGKTKMTVKLSLVGKNLLNQEYAIRPALAGAPINFAVRLDVGF
jgi:outer membrane receptor protein involved in Fe transport